MHVVKDLGFPELVVNYVPNDFLVLDFTLSQIQYLLDQDSEIIVVELDFLNFLEIVLEVLSHQVDLHSQNIGLEVDIGCQHFKFRTNRVIKILQQLVRLIVQIAGCVVPPTLIQFLGENLELLISVPVNQVLIVVR